MSAPLVFWLAIRTKNPMNTSFGNTRRAAIVAHRIDAAQRDTARAGTIRELALRRAHPADLLPAVVTLTRHSPGTLDAHDGLPAALKRVVDGVALALGIDDGGPFVRWRYAQRKCRPGLYGVHVRIERADVCTAGTARGSA